MGYRPVLILFLLGCAHMAVGARLGSRSGSDDALRYYSRANCEAAGHVPLWMEPGYLPETHFESLFRSPLNIDLIAAAHSGNETGFEQVTADWGCDFEGCYGTGESGNGCETIGFYGPGAKDPAGGGCPRGPVKVYEDLTCAIKLGLKDDPNAFTSFCDATNPDMGMFECLAFFANVLTETGAFSETEERDPRPYCWDRSEGNTNCCPAADHKPCLPDSDKPLNAGDYPQPSEKWLTDSDAPEKCCSYHGRGFLQVSYEPNYKAMSQALFGDETILWNHPYKLDSDGVMGWSAALWFWFKEHPAQVGNKPEEPVENLSPRSEIYRWSEGRGLPGAINVINGAECSGGMDSMKAYSRVSYFFAIAHRMGAKPPTSAGEPALTHYPLPGTSECDNNAWCKQQFHNGNSICPAFNSHLDCSAMPYIVNASTPMGFNRHTIKMTAIDGQTPICKGGRRTATTPDVWSARQEGLTPIDDWWKMLDITTENVCDYVRLMHAPDASQPDVLEEGESKYCTEMCWYHFSWEVNDHGKQCAEPQKPCKTMAEYMSHPLPRRGFQSGDMGDYMGGAYLGRVGPGLVMAMNGPQGLGDSKDSLCFHFGASACHWNVAMGCYVESETNTHGCRIFPPGVPEGPIMKSISSSSVVKEKLKPGERPQELWDALEYYDESNCPAPTGRTILEQLFPKGAADMDFLFSVHYSQSDGFANRRYDQDEPGVNKNSILHGFKGPMQMWKKMLCAFQLGVPSDPDYFQKNFGLRTPVSSSAEVPYPLSEDEKRFAQLEFIAMAANMVKETGAMGQAEEQDPRCYCNNQGGAENTCCPNEWGNNPSCYDPTNSQNTIIPPEFMKKGLTSEATCCSYHGRGFLQTSYERNYGDLGAFMFKNHAISEDLGRKLLLNYPQTIDPFGVTGWTTTFAFWLHPHPCQYCEGRNTTTVDWNAPEYSPHTAMVNFDKPGQGLGMTFTIINGVECENAEITEADISMQGSQMRLSIFYNLAYRLKVKAPGENTILPLPGTKECDASPFCRGTFYETDVPVAAYRAHSGGCWALTPQPKGEFEMWTWCKANSYIQGSSKLGAHLDMLSFTMKKTDPNSCELLHEFRCGTKLVNPKMKPSMFSDEELVGYTQDKTITEDYEDPEFLRLQGLGPEELCQYVVDRNPGNSWPPSNQDCNFWCSEPSGAASCKAMDTKTCHMNGSGKNFVECANKFFQTTNLATDCQIVVPGDVGPNNPPPPPPATTPKPSACSECSACISADGNQDAQCKQCGFGEHSSVWPCSVPDFCKCDETAPVEPKPEDCTDSCKSCISKSGRPEEDAHCSKCAGGASVTEWPCNGTTMCKCNGDITLPTTTPTTTTKVTNPPQTPAPGGKAGVCSDCSECKSVDGWGDDACAKCIGMVNWEQEWPCNNSDYCKCTA